MNIYTNFKTIASLTFAGLFSLSANAGDFSNLDYEYYAESSVWPTDASNFNSSTSMASSTVEDLSGYDYEDYAQSSNFPDPSLLYNEQSMRNIAEIQRRIEENPTASGPGYFADEVLLYDLFGDDIHAQ